jgi:hypothetical protein
MYPEVVYGPTLVKLVASPSSSRSSGGACLPCPFVPFECRAYIRHTRATGPAIPVAAAAAVFANWLRRYWWAVKGPGEWCREEYGRARVSPRGVRRPRRAAQLVFAYRRRPYDTTAVRCLPINGSGGAIYS